VTLQTGRPFTPKLPTADFTGQRYRYRVLGGEVGSYVDRNIYPLLAQKPGVGVLKCNVQPDHVHLQAEIPPKYSVSDIMGFLKGKLALRVFKQYPQFGRQYWGRHFWARGYCVSTVGLDEEKMRRYVRWQETKERAEEEAQGRLF
jgi:putative transposase